jgi:Phage Mu protein F like protein
MPPIPRRRLSPATRLLRAADQQVPPLRTDTLHAFAAMRYALSRTSQALKGALASQNMLLVDPLLTQAVATGMGGLRRALLAHATAVIARVTQSAAPPVRLATFAEAVEVEILGRFDLTNPWVVQAISEAVGTQIRAIDDRTLLAVRQLVRQGFEGGRTPASMARQLRDWIGLTPLQSQATARLRDTLAHAGHSARDVAARVERAVAKKIRERAELIARTESLRAANLGQHLLWLQADQQGLWDRDTMRRVWVITPDERLCPEVCQPIPGMNPQGVLLDQPFQTPRGLMQYPPAHPRCRCCLASRRLP